MFRTSVLALALAAPSGMAVAQDYPATDRSAQDRSAQAADVTVRARADRNRQAFEYVRNLTATSTHVDPLQRFNPKTVCPGVTGLSEQRNGEITARMRRIARHVGLETAKADCKPTALVIFVDDKEEMIDALYREYPMLFGNERHREVPPAKEPGPATAWHIKIKVDSDGIGVSREDVWIGAYRWGEVSVVSSPKPGSRLVAMARTLFVGSVVVIERESIIGLTPTQIADYAAMRSFAASRPDKMESVGAETILTVLTAGPDDRIPMSLTAWDLTFLEGLYTGPPMRVGGSQRSEIRGKLTRLAEAQADE